MTSAIVDYIMVISSLVTLVNAGSALLPLSCVK